MTFLWTPLHLSHQEEVLTSCLSSYSNCPYFSHIPTPPFKHLIKSMFIGTHTHRAHSTFVMCLGLLSADSISAKPRHITHLTLHPYCTMLVVASVPKYLQENFVVSQINNVDFYGIFRRHCSFPYLIPLFRI